MGVNGGASGFNFFVAVSGVATAAAAEGVDAADGSSIVLRFAIAMRCLASMAAFCFSSNSAFVFAMISSNSFLRFCASAAFRGVAVFAAAVVAVPAVVVVVAAGVDVSGVFAVDAVPVGAAAAGAAAAEPKGVDGVPNGVDGFPNGAVVDLLPLPNAGVEVAAAPNPVDGFEPNIPPMVGVEAAVGDAPDDFVANELKTEPKAGFAENGATEEPNGDNFAADAALPNGDAVVVVVLSGAEAAASAEAAGFFSSCFSSCFSAACSLTGEGAMVTAFGFSVASFGFSVVVCDVGALIIGCFNADFMG